MTNIHRCIVGGAPKVFLLAFTIRSYSTIQQQNKIVRSDIRSWGWGGGGTGTIFVATQSAPHGLHLCSSLVPRPFFILTFGGPGGEATYAGLDRGGGGGPGGSTPPFTFEIILQSVDSVATCAVLLLKLRLILAVYVCVVSCRARAGARPTVW